MGERRRSANLPKSQDPSARPPMKQVSTVDMARVVAPKMCSRCRVQIISSVRLEMPDRMKAIRISGCNGAPWGENSSIVAREYTGRHGTCHYARTTRVDEPRKRATPPPGETYPINCQCQSAAPYRRSVSLRRVSPKKFH